MICFNLLCTNCDVYEHKESLPHDNTNSVCPSNKTEPHYETINNQCLPSCGTAARLAGYGGYGADGQAGTSDDPHVYVRDASSCKGIEALNQDDWKNFTFQDTFNSIPQSNDQIKEVVKSGGVCCVQGDSQNTDDNDSDEEDDNNDSTPDNFPHRVESAPNMQSVINRLAEQCPEIMQAVWDESKQSWSGDLRFLDLAVEALRAKDKRWGYTFWERTGHTDSWSADRVGYFHGAGNPNNSTDMTVIDYLAPRRENGKWVYYPSWHDATESLKTDYPDATGYWKYPRPGATVSLSDCTGNTTTTTTTTHPPVTRIGTEPGECEVPNKFAVLQQVAADHPDLLRNSNNCPPHYRNGGTYEFLKTALVRLRKADTRWGYYHRTQHNLQYASPDAIAYYCGDGNGNRSSDLRFVDVITSSCQVSWQDSLEGHAARARPENGYWKYPR